MFKVFHRQRFFITGGTGFFGKALLNQFYQASQKHNALFDITLLSRNPSKFLQENPHLESLNLKFLEGDIQSFEADLIPFDYLIHMASSSNAQAYQMAPELMFENIVGGTSHFCQQAKGSQAKCLFMSSGAVYGEPPQWQAPYSEKQQLQAVKRIYAQAKQLAEAVFQSSALNGLIARGFAFYGPSQPKNWHFMVPVMIRQARETGAILVQNPRTLRTLMHEEDLARAIATLLTHGELDEIYNIGASRVTWSTDVAQLIAHELDSEVIVDAHYTGPASIYWPQVNKLKSLGFEETIGLEQGIRELCHVV